MANEAGKLMAARKAAMQAQQGKQASPMQAQAGAGPVVSSDKDSEFQEKWHDRGYNPIDEAKKGSVSSSLNEDSGRYRKGPGPV